MNCDIFISYRRDGGRDVARNVELALQGRGYKNIFFDYNSIRNGVFNEQIIDAISVCKDFILVLSENSMDRCTNKGDWVAREIRTALRTGCNIIPLTVGNFRDFPKCFPDDLAALKNYQRTKLHTDDYFGASIDRLVERLKTQHEDNDGNNKVVGAEIHITSDANCRVYDYGKDLKVDIIANRDAIIWLKKGNHELKFVSSDDNSAFQDNNYSVPDNDYVDKIDVKLLSKVSKLTNLRKDEEQKEKEYNTLVKKLKEKLPPKLKFNISQDATITFNLNATKTKYTATGVDKVNRVGFLASPSFNSLVNYVGGDYICQELSKKEGLDVSFQNSVYIINVFPKSRRGIKFSNMNYFIEKYLPEYIFTKSGEFTKTKQENKDVYIVCPHCKRKAKTDLKAIEKSVKDENHQLDVNDLHAVATSLAIPTAALIGVPMIGIAATGIGLAFTGYKKFKKMLNSDDENTNVEITCPHCYSKFTIKV